MNGPSGYRRDLQCFIESAEPEEQENMWTTTPHGMTYVVNDPALPPTVFESKSEAVS